MIEGLKELRPKTRKFVRKLIKDYGLADADQKLAVLCGMNWDQALAAKEKIDAEGDTFKDRFDQVKSHPSVAVLRDCSISYSRLLRELNLDFSSPDAPRPPGLKY